MRLNTINILEEHYLGTTNLKTLSESFGKPIKCRILTEGLTDNIKAFWAKIKKFFIDMWTKFKLFCKKIWETITGKKKSDENNTKKEIEKENKEIIKNEKETVQLEKKNEEIIEKIKKSNADEDIKDRALDIKEKLEVVKKEINKNKDYVLILRQIIDSISKDDSSDVKILNLLQELSNLSNKYDANLSEKIKKSIKEFTELKIDEDLETIDGTLVVLHVIREKGIQRMLMDISNNNVKKQLEVLYNGGKFNSDLVDVSLFQQGIDYISSELDDIISMDNTTAVKKIDMANFDEDITDGLNETELTKIQKECSLIIGNIERSDWPDGKDSPEYEMFLKFKTSVAISVTNFFHRIIKTLSKLVDFKFRIMKNRHDAATEAIRNVVEEIGKGDEKIKNTNEEIDKNLEDIDNMLNDL